MGYPTDVTDEEWIEIAPHLSQTAPTGRPRTVDLRQVFNALRYKNRTGCQWGMLPEGFPPKRTVFDYHQKWTQDGTWIRINDRLRERVREALDRDAHPHIAVVDSQSVKTTEAGGDCGFDAGKKYGSLGLPGVAPKCSGLPYRLLGGIIHAYTICVS